MSIHKILCCTDFSENAGIALEAAIEMAEKYNAKLIAVHVLPPVVNPLLMDPEWIMPEEPKTSMVLKLEERINQEYGEKIGDRIDFEFVVLDGHVSTEIINYVEENHVDMIVLGAYGLTGMGLVLFGSVAKRVAHKAPCSVMIVRRKETNAS